MSLDRNQNWRENEKDNRSSNSNNNNRNNKQQDDEEEDDDEKNVYIVDLGKFMVTDSDIGPRQRTGGTLFSSKKNVMFTHSFLKACVQRKKKKTTTSTNYVTEKPVVVVVQQPTQYFDLHDEFG